MPVDLAGARWPEVEHADRRLLVVPVGSLEQHGPHLPLGTDTTIAVAVARRACAGRAGAGHAGLPGGDAHAGRSETSVMLALAPAEVRLDLAERGDTRPVGQLVPALRARGVRAVSPNGVLGDPAGASAAEGEQILARLTAALSALVDRLLGPG